MVRGADVSSWQDDATIAAIEHEQLGFAFVKLTQGVGYIDRGAAQRVELLHAHGLAVGVYHYLTPTPSAELQWSFFHSTLIMLAHLGVPVGRLIFSVDYEAQGATDADAAAFIAAARRDGFLVGCYSSAGTHGYAELGQAWRWVAAWGSSAPRRPWAFWQFADQPAHDWDLFNGSPAALKRFWGRYAGLGGYQVAFAGTPAHTARYRSPRRAALGALAYAIAHPRRRGYTVTQIAP